ncbi:hypothetical protein BDR26DRAFT_875539 [Obelidium mucronatum]|nr:hypothetical protein BDR26DRAFT_875539 [Obelidium mucronatum]
MLLRELDSRSDSRSDSCHDTNRDCDRSSQKTCTSHSSSKTASTSVSSSYSSSDSSASQETSQTETSATSETIRSLSSKCTETSSIITTEIQSATDASESSSNESSTARSSKVLTSSVSRNTTNSDNSYTLSSLTTFSSRESSSISSSYASTLLQSQRSFTTVSDVSSSVHRKLSTIKECIQTLRKYHNTFTLVILPAWSLFTSSTTTPKRVKRRESLVLQSLFEIFSIENMNDDENQVKSGSLVIPTEPFQFTKQSENTNDWEWDVTVAPEIQDDSNSNTTNTQQHKDAFFRLSRRTNLFGTHTTSTNTHRVQTIGTNHQATCYQVQRRKRPPPPPSQSSTTQESNNSKQDLQAQDQDDPRFIYTCLKKSLSHNNKLHQLLPVSVLLRHLANSPLSSQINQQDKRTPKFIYSTIAESLVARYSTTDKNQQPVSSFDFACALENKLLWYKLAHTLVSRQSSITERTSTGRVLLILLTRVRMSRSKFIRHIEKEFQDGGGGGGGGGAVCWLFDAVMASLSTAFTIKVFRWKCGLGREVLKEKIGLLAVAGGLMGVFGEHLCKGGYCHHVGPGGGAGGKKSSINMEVWILGISRGIRECYKLSTRNTRAESSSSGSNNSSSNSSKIDPPDEVAVACMNLLSGLSVLLPPRADTKPEDSKRMGLVDWATIKDVASFFPCWQTRDSASYLLRKMDVHVKNAARAATGMKADTVPTSWRDACERQIMHPCMLSVLG